MKMITKLTVVDGKITYPQKEPAARLLDIKAGTVEDGGFRFCDENETSGQICKIDYVESRKRAELCYTTEAEYMNQGYMTRAMTQALAWMRENGIKGCLWLLIAEDNMASQRIAQKFGFLPQEEFVGEQRWYCLNFDT